MAPGQIQTSKAAAVNANSITISSRLSDIESGLTNCTDRMRNRLETIRGCFPENLTNKDSSVLPPLSIEALLSQIEQHVANLRGQISELEQLL